MQKLQGEIYNTELSKVIMLCGSLAENQEIVQNILRKGVYDMVKR